MKPDDTRRLNWLLSLLWDTGHRDDEGDEAKKTLNRLRRELQDHCFPFRDAIDAVMRWQEETR